MAAMRLGGTRDPRAFEPLIAALDDGHPNVQIRAAGSLGKIKGPKAVEPLIALLTDNNDSVRGAAAAALGELEDSRAMESLIAAVRKEDRWFFARMRGLVALAKLGHAGAAEAVRERRSDKWWRENKEDLLRSR